MPWGCGTWPAYWLVGPDWAKNGEIDIIEGVNTGLDNSISMHTEAGCTIAGSGQTATFQTSNCDHNLNGNSGCGSSLKHESIPNNYGDDLNRNGGGVYATEWTSEYVKHWFFPRGSTPANIASGNPDPATWGTPTVNAQGDCDIDSHFNNMSIIINTDFCGAWAGWVYQSQFPECPQNMNVSSLDSCVDFVGNNPSYFVDAYWEINSLRVFQMPEGSEASEPYSTSLSSVTPAASTAGTSGLPVGPGASTGDVSSAPYTGPTSSGTVSAPASTSTPIICPDYNGTVWTNSNSQQYSIACGSDYQGGGPSFGAQSFANCMEICDGTDGCRAVSFTGGNGAGVCYIKTERGSFNYDGVTNAAERESGTGSASSSIQAPIISSRPATSYGDVSSTLSRRDMSTSSTVRMSSPRDTSVTSSSMLAYESENMSTVGLSTAASPSPPALSMLTSRPAPESTRTSASQSQTSTSVAIMPSGAAGTSSTHSSSPVMDIELPTSSERPGYESAVRTSSRTRSTSSAGVSSSRSSSSSEAPGGYTSTMAGQQSSTSSVALPPSSSIIPVLPSSYVAPSNVMPPSSSMASSSPMAPSSSMVPSSSMAPPSSMVPSSYIAPSSRVALSSSVAPLSSMASSSSIASPSYISPSSYIGPPVSSSVRQSSSTLPGPIFYTSQRSISSTSTRTSGSTVPAIVSTTSSASFTPGPNSTPTFIAPPAEQLAPSCPADAEDLCNDSEESSICSSESGSNYGVTCGVAYQGVVLNPNVYRRKRQSYEPSLQQCTNLCDTTTGCVAFNYIGTDCTLFSSVTGTYYAPGAVGAAQVTPPTTATPVTPPVYTSPSSVGQAPQSDTTTGATSTQPIFCKFTG